MQENIGSIILNTFEKDKQKHFLKNYITGEQYTGEETINIVHKIATTLIAEEVEAGSRVAIYSQNCPEWTMVDIACLQSKLISVPIFATNNSHETDYILHDAGVQVIFVGTQSQYREILKIDRREQFRIIIFDEKVNLQTDNSIHFKNWINQYDPKGYDSDLEERTNSITKNDLATLIYTSGTTGEPKGVELIHHQFTSLLENHNLTYEFKPSYTSIAFLPLSHVYERGWTYIVLANGMTNVYLSDPKIIADAIYNVKPETVCAVPRLYEKIYAKIMDEISSQSLIKKKIFHWAVGVGKNRLKYTQENKSVPLGLSLKYKIADRLVFQKILEKLGGNMVYAPCGGAYMPDKLVEFFLAIGLPMLVGYGLTEASATVTSFTLENFKVGTVGKPIINVDVKIGENNEILVKGDTITRGYYKLEEESKKHYTEDGWFKTGDAGHLDEEGYLVITDRIKQLIKTANGKYIAPQLVEAQISQSPFISQAMVIGEGKPFAAAILTLNREYAEKWANRKQIEFDKIDNLLENERMLKSLDQSIKKKQLTLSSYERVKRYKVLPNEFTMENDELTPTLKLKRKVILERYSDLIDTLYK
ncbi:AMP-binding protein [Flavobacteriaceae bacterium Ap0902]|nr:AMP-binding protein [Flavobacteriaceae bacterium Ap0902]